MEQREILELEQPQAPERNYLVCLSVLAALNLGIVIAVSQVSGPLMNIESLLPRVDSQSNSPTDGSGYVAYFPSCTGGGSVNCHTRGNQAGL